MYGQTTPSVLPQVWQKIYQNEMKINIIINTIKKRTNHNFSGLGMSSSALRHRGELRGEACTF